MADRGLLQHTEPPHLTTKRMADGARRRVLSLATAYPAPEAGQSEHPGHGSQHSGQNGHCCPDHVPRPATASGIIGAENRGSIPENIDKFAPLPQ